MCCQHTQNDGLVPYTDSIHTHAHVHTPALRFLPHGVCVQGFTMHSLTMLPIVYHGLFPESPHAAFLVYTDRAEETRPLLILYKVSLGRAFDALHTVLWLS